MSLSAGTPVGSYEIVAPLGSGGMGEVYRARDRKLDREVAIKILPKQLAADPERIVRFEREGESTRHPEPSEHRTHPRPGRVRRRSCAGDGAGRGADARRSHFDVATDGTLVYVDASGAMLRAHTLVWVDREGRE